MALVETPRENRFITWTDWDGYNHILYALHDRAVHVTYDRGKLELLTPSRLHEKIKKLLDRVIVLAMEAHGVNFESGGSTTFRKILLDRGLEPDECYFIQNADAFSTDYDPEAGPPPDLAVEVEVTRSALDRMEIYRALGVPEVWRYDGAHRFVVEVLHAQGFQTAATSPSLPWLPLELVPEMVRFGLEQGEVPMMRECRQRLRGPG